MLFAAPSETLRTVAADPRHLGTDIGFLAVLHTWDQTLRHHPHLHCVVPGGGLSDERGWHSCRRGFFLPVNVLARLLRRLFLQGLERAYETGQTQLSWYLRIPGEADRIQIDYSRMYGRVSGGSIPNRLLVVQHKCWLYLGRYTHRVAISNHWDESDRLENVDPCISTLIERTDRVEKCDSISIDFPEHRAYGPIRISLSGVLHPPSFPPVVSGSNTQVE